MLLSRKLGYLDIWNPEGERHIFFCNGKDEGDPGEHGVGFAIKNMLLGAVQVSIDATE